MFVPQFQAAMAREYVWQIGDPVPTTGLWVRYNEDELPDDGVRAEYPIYQNTRGMCVYNATDPETSNAGESEPTDAFWQALGAMHNGQMSEGIDVEDCEWYEVEFINSLVGMLVEHDADDLPMEIGELFDHATREVRGGGASE